MAADPTTSDLSTARTAPPLTTATVIIAAAFVLSLTMADVAATKFVEVFGIVTPAGAMLFAVIFVLRDLIHKTAGARTARTVIRWAVVLNVGAGLYLFLMTLLPAPDFRPSGEFDALFAFAPGIVLGSVVAAYASQMVNTWVYQRLWDRDWVQWARTVGSNLVSLPVDAVLFTAVAFVIVPPIVGAEPINVADAFARVASGQTAFKAAVMLACTPIVYLIPTNPAARENR